MKIAACFSSRADYAPLYPVISELEKRGAEVMQFDLCTGPMKDDTPLSCSMSLIKGMRYLAAALSYENPDIVLLLGDRYETLGAAQIATLFQIPIAHIHGGETTEGSFDNEFRHAITQLATYHFAATEESAQRIYDMTGNKNVELVGAPGLDNINDLPPREIAQPYFLVTYHPPTKREFDEIALVDALNEAHGVDALNEAHGFAVVWTGVNNDPGKERIFRAFNRRLVTPDPPGTMPVKKYLSYMKYASCCIGNSSSFLIEAPALGVPSVNVGDRQKGRLHGPSVFDVPEDRDQIVRAIRKALAYKGPFDNPYGGPGASKKIADILMPNPTSQSEAA